MYIYKYIILDIYRESEREMTGNAMKRNRRLHYKAAVHV